MSVRLSLALVLLFSSLALAAPAPPPTPRPKLPDDRTIDSFEYTSTPAVLGPAASFSITRAGKVRYHYESQPGTDSGGVVVQKEWDIPAREAVALLRGLMDDGLLDLEDTLGGKFPNHHFRVTYGRWQFSAHPREMPAPIMKRLQPYLEKAHPELWKKR